MESTRWNLSPRLRKNPFPLTLSNPSNHLPVSMRFFLVATLALILSACGGGGENPPLPSPDDSLQVVAELDTTQITGVAVSGSGRLFVNAPYWSDAHGMSVMEVMEDGSVRPFPNEAMNQPWSDTLGVEPADTFVSVQSVYVDPENPETLWILDPASPKFAGTVAGGVKLIEVDLSNDAIVRTITFDASVAPEGSYLNDVRVTSDQRFAYITDSNLGAVVVVDLANESARRVLDEHPSTSADSTYVPVIGGSEWRTLEGTVPQIASDGIAISPDDASVYLHALTGTRLYRVSAAALNDASLSADNLAEQVEDLGETVVTDGMIADEKGRIYHSALEADAVVRYAPEGTIDTLVQDPRLRWPDSFAIGPDDHLYVTTSQIHLSPQYNRNIDRRRDPYRVFRYPLDGE